MKKKFTAASYQRKRVPNLHFEHTASAPALRIYLYNKLSWIETVFYRKYNSLKVCEVTWAFNQSKEALSFTLNIYFCSLCFGKDPRGGKEKHKNLLGNHRNK